MSGETVRPSTKTPTRDGRLGRSLTIVAAVLCLLAVAVVPAATAPADSLDRIGDLLSSGLRGAASAPATPRIRPAAQAAPTVAAVPDENALRLSGWSIGGDESRTVVTVDLSHPAPLRVFTLLTPTRVVVDLPAARFDDVPGGARAGRGLVSAWRFGALSAHRSRLVLDTRATVRITRAEFDSTAPAGKTRLVVELVTASRDEMRRAAAIDVGSGLVAVAGSAAPQRSDAAAPATGRPVVVIDAGHGGGDAGTVSPATGTPEKSVVLEMSKTLVRRLRETGRYEVVATREDDVFLGLGERVRIARARRADLFLSIHADAEYDHSVRGATIYTLAETASDEKAAALAAKENQSEVIAGYVVEEAEPEVADILADLTLRETRHLSHLFARDLLDEYRRHGRLVKSQPHRQAGLKVLRAHDIPSALVELGFLSNKEDEALLTSPEWREKTAASLVSAIDRYFVGRNALAGPTKDVGARAPASP
jgi:N-acetylmuramoyl-L-alanine amidase